MEERMTRCACFHLALPHAQDANVHIYSFGSDNHLSEIIIHRLDHHHMHHTSVRSHFQARLELSYGQFELIVSYKCDVNSGSQAKNKRRDNY